MIKSYYLFMMDTVFRGGRPTPGAVELLHLLNEKGMPFVILSEMSGKTRFEQAQRMNDAGFHSIRALDIYTSSIAAVDWIRWMYPSKNKVSMIGGVGMRDAIEKANLEITRIQPDWLFLGMNTNMTYIDYCDALQTLDTGAKLIVVDGRKTMMKDGARMLGNASIAHMLAYASDSEIISFARGTDRLLIQGMKYFNVPAESVTMVGTHFQKDILPAMKLGLNTVYVTQGNSIMNLGMSDQIHPDYIVEDLFGLTK